MTLLIIITAILFIISILLEPHLSRFIERLHPQKQEEKQDIPILKQETEQPVIGKSNYELPLLKQDSTSTEHKAATPLESVNPIENQSTFAPSQPENSLADEGVVLERQDSPATEEEPEDITTALGQDAGMGSGMDFSELGTIKNAVENPQTQLEVQRQAGQILYDNRSTEMVEKMIANPLTSHRISSLIDIRTQEYIREHPETGNNPLEEEEEEYKNFNPLDFINN